MVSGTGAFSGAASGAQLGSKFGPWGTAIGAGIGGIAGLFGGGKSDVEKAAERDLLARMNRGEQAWKWATGDISKARNYFAPIAGGSREAALTAAAPEITAANERLGFGRQSLFSMAPRSGGAGAMLDPYTQAKTATNILTSQRPTAANAMLDIAKTEGGWANMGQGGAGTMFEQERWRQEQKEKEGAAAYDTLKRLMPILQEQFGFGGDKGGGGETKKNNFGSTIPSAMQPRSKPKGQSAEWNPQNTGWYG